MVCEKSININKGVVSSFRWLVRSIHCLLIFMESWDKKALLNDFYLKADLLYASIFLEIKYRIVICNSTYQNNKKEFITKL